MQKTFPRLMLDHAQQRPQAPALREKVYGIWQTTTWAALALLVRRLACGLAQAGVQRGDHLIVVGENRPRLYATMLAAQALGAVPVPLYQDAAAAEYSFPINNAEVAWAVVEDQEQVDKLLELREQCPGLTHIWFDDPRGLRNYAEAGLDSIDALLEAGQAHDAAQPRFFDDAVARCQADDVAAMFFTSGTTGNPKGVVHSHASLLDRASAGQRFDKLTAQEEVLAYMPLAWIGQNIFSYAQWLACGYVVNCPESAATVMIDLKEIGPTYYFAPPRIFEGLLTSVMIRMEDAGRFKRWLFQHFMAVARRVGPAMMDGKPVGVLDRLAYALGNVLCLRPAAQHPGLQPRACGLHRRRGHRPRPLHLLPLHRHQPQAALRQHRNRGVRVPAARPRGAGRHRGRAHRRRGNPRRRQRRNPGQEPGPAEGLLQEPRGHRRGADGRRLVPHRRRRLSGCQRPPEDHRPRQGRGPPAAEPGWQRHEASEGALFAPKYVENKLKFFPFIKEAVAFGDQREMVCAFVNIDFEAVGNWAERRNLPYAGYTDLASKKEVLELVRECVEKVNADLAADALLAGSQISRFLVLHKELDADDGEMTRTRKVKRSYISDKYQVLVDALYGGKREQFIETAVKFEDGRTGSVSATLPIVDAKTFPAMKRAA